MNFANGHALVVGIGTYAYEPSMNVPITAQDAAAVQQMLRDPQRCGYPDAQVHYLNNEQATRAAVLAKLDELAATVKPEDTVFLFYSGHGEFGDDGTYYLTTYDTRLNPDTKKVAPDGGIREQELLLKLKNIPAQRAILIFNACHSGEISPEALGGDSAPAQDAGANMPDQTATALLATGEGRVIITACRGSQRSYFSRRDQNTVFTQALLDALSGNGTPNRHGFISIFDLYEYLFSTVEPSVRSRWGVEQEPELTISKGVGVMAVALHRGSAQQDAALLPGAPETLGGAVRRVEPAEAQQALQQVMGDYIEANSSQGFINRATGPVTQTFDNRQFNTGGGDIAQGPIDKRNFTISGDYAGGNMDKRQINTGGGDYVQGNLDKRSGTVNISGGTVSGPVTGFNTGNITYTGGPPAEIPPLQQAASKVADLLSQARQAKDFHAMRALQNAEMAITAAIEAETSANLGDRTTWIGQAQSDLQPLGQQPNVQQLLHLLQQS